MACRPTSKCYNVCICCKCCGEEKNYKIEVPCNAVIAQASLTNPLNYTNTAETTIIFNSVTLNEGVSNCYSCQSSPCCCKKKKKKCKNRCSSECNSCSSYSSCPPQWGGCPPYGACPPYGGCPTQFGGVWPWGACQFYNASTGIASVPMKGAGYYFISVVATTNSINTSSLRLKINGTTVVTSTFGVVPGNPTGVIATTQQLCDGASISVTVQDDTAAAILASGAQLNIVRLY